MLLENSPPSPVTFLMVRPLLKLYPSHLTCFLSQACMCIYTRNQPQPSRENVRCRIDRYNDRKARLLDVLPISSWSYHQKLCIHFKSSKYWPTLHWERPNERYRNTVKDLLYRIPLAKRLKNRIPQGWMIPQYRKPGPLLLFQRNRGRPKTTLLNRSFCWKVVV